MARPPALTQSEKTRIVLAVLARETTLAAAAARHGVSAQAIANWRTAFVSAGEAALCPRAQARRTADLSQRRVQQLMREMDDLKIALAEAHLAARVRPHLRAS